MSRTLRLLFVLFSSCLLTACYNVAISGAQAAYNRHGLQKNIDDGYTSIQAYRTIDKQGNAFKDTNITVATFNDSVLLTGQVPNERQKQQLQKIIQEIAG